MKQTGSDRIFKLSSHLGLGGRLCVVLAEYALRLLRWCHEAVTSVAAAGGRSCVCAVVRLTVLRAMS